MKKYIVVTGGAGFIGSNLIDYLISKTSYKIISLDNYSSGSKKNHINNKRVQYIIGDTNDINKKLEKYKNQIKVIFHFGEFARIHQSFVDTYQCFSSNISGTSKVFYFCVKNKIKIIYSATSASLGNKGSDQNLSPYAFTKSKNLNLLERLKKWFNQPYEALYFYNVYGPRQIKKGFMATVIGIFEDQFEKKISLSVVRPGTQSRKFTHVQDTIEGCYFAWKKNKNRHYSLSNSKSYRIIDVAKMFSNKVKMIPSKLGERMQSATVKKIGKIKIYSLPCSRNLKNYIIDFKHNMLK
jgi:UDP-glucose 4-epimerase